MAAKNKSSGDDDFAPISDINITPFVDVVLVLLVIFMVTAPMLVREQLAVNLPKTQTGEKSASKAITIFVDKEGILSYEDQKMTLSDIEVAVKKAVSENPNIQAVIGADKDAKHGDVVNIIDVIKKTGLTKFAIQIQRN